MIRIGTSGWSYEHWFSRFYPKGLPKTQAFEYYQTVFDTVEINASFYRLMEPKTYGLWNKKANSDFLFSVKANRFITHVKRLKDYKLPLEKFFNAIRPLGNKTGPILFQLPPNFKKDITVLQHFIEELPKEFRYAFEFRNDSWFESNLYDLLRDNNIALVFSDSPFFRYVEEITADLIYMRFHGPSTLYTANYSDDQLATFAQKILRWSRMDLDIFAYFNNDAKAFAPQNALKLKDMVQRQIKAA